MDLKNKNVLVLGGVGGIGSAFCDELINAKISKLAVIDLLPEVPQAFLGKAKNVEFKYRKAAVDNQNELKVAMEELSKELGGFDVIINSVGILKENDAAKMIAVNYTGVVNSTQNAIALMRKDTGGAGRGGFIINVASIAGLVFPFVVPHYAGTKHAVLGYTKSLANETFHQRTGLSFIVICPGMTETPILDGLMKTLVWPEMKDEIMARVGDYPMQQTKVVGECLIKAIVDGENGSVWKVENSRIEKISLEPYPTWH